MEPDLRRTILCHFLNIRDIPAGKVPALMASLPPQRKEKALALRAEGRRMQSLAAGLLAKRVLGTVGLSDTLLQYDENGKPYIHYHPEWYITLTHSGDYAACALSRFPVAVDIQRRDGVKEALLRRGYNPDERAYCNAAPDREAAFYDLWCRKECKAKLHAYAYVREIDALEPDPGFRYWSFEIPGYSCALYGAADCEQVITEGLP